MKGRGSGMGRGKERALKREAAMAVAKEPCLVVKWGLGKAVGLGRGLEKRLGVDRAAPTVSESGGEAARQRVRKLGVEKEEGSGRGSVLELASMTVKEWAAW